MGRIPDRWDSYSALGSTVGGTRFIPFKVPLKEAICRQNGMPPEMWFTPKGLVGTLKEKGSELGLVIDLTNTTRYYQPQEITEEGIGYKKIFTEGHSVPSITVKQNFFEAVDSFLEENKDNNRLIGVHCTHGLNRTGYLVCRYMIDRMNITSSDAITAFNQARGYNIERENYLDDLNGVVVPTSPKSVAEAHHLHSDTRNRGSGRAPHGEQTRWRERRPEPRSSNREWRESHRHEEFDAYHRQGEFHGKPWQGNFYSDAPPRRPTREFFADAYHGRGFPEQASAQWGYARYDNPGHPYGRPVGYDFSYGRMPDRSWRSQPESHSPYQSTGLNPDSVESYPTDSRYNYEQDVGFSNSLQ